MPQNQQPLAAFGSASIYIGKDLPEGHIYKGFALPDDVIVHYEEESNGCCDFFLTRVNGELEVRWMRSNEFSNDWVEELITDLEEIADEVGDLMGQIDTAIANYMG